MTRKQLEVLSSLQDKGWQVAHLGNCSMCGGPTPIQDPEGKMFNVMPDGSIEEIKD